MLKCCVGSLRAGNSFYLRDSPKRLVVINNSGTVVAYQERGESRRQLISGSTLVLHVQPNEKWTPNDAWLAWNKDTIEKIQIGDMLVHDTHRAPYPAHQVWRVTKLVTVGERLQVTAARLSSPTEPMKLNISSFTLINSDQVNYGAKPKR